MSVNTISVAGVEEYNSCRSVVALVHNTDTKRVMLNGVAIETAKLKLLFDYLVKEEEELHHG